MTIEHVDVLIVGAGISGIGAGVHLQDRCPDRRFLILEGREDLGGTWDLFRYPGIRSDSDMHTLGFSFKPWTAAKAIADGPSILGYLRETVDEFGLADRIRYRHRLTRADWSPADACWNVEIERATDDGVQTISMTCAFLFMCTGYYDYAGGHDPEIAGEADFRGPVIHPQHWPEDLDHAGRNVVVIGSGATAVTLVPALAESAASVTMLQRTPTYVVSRPQQDGVANWLRRCLPSRLAYGLTRWKNVLLGMYFFRLTRTRPERAKAFILDPLRERLGEEAVAEHFTPPYDPWDQRLCLVPDGDLFEVLEDGRAEVVTDTIERFTATGLRLSSGRELAADIVVKATGLKLQFLAGIDLRVDGAPVELPEHHVYKGMMLSDVPNLAWSMGYTNASWTLKADLTSGYVCRLLNHMTRHGYRACTPRLHGADVGDAPFMELTSGYVQRAMDRFPKQGVRPPWRLNQNYALDLAALRLGRVHDGVMEFSSPDAQVESAAPTAA